MQQQLCMKNEAGGCGYGERETLTAGTASTTTPGTLINDNIQSGER